MSLSVAGSKLKAVTCLSPERAPGVIVAQTSDRPLLRVWKLSISFALWQDWRPLFTWVPYLAKARE